jgi:hypothetical protein
LGEVVDVVPPAAIVGEELLRPLRAEFPRGRDRLRLRGTATRRAFDYLAELGISDHWMEGTVEQPSPFSLSGWVNRIWGGQAKVHTARLVGKEEGNEESDWSDVVLGVSLGLGLEVLQVSARMIARLVNYMAVRPRDAGTGLLIRAKTAQYAKELHLPAEYVSFVIHDTITLGFVVPVAEGRHLRIIGRGGSELVAWSEQVKSGVLIKGESRLAWAWRLMFWWLYAVARGSTRVMPVRLRELLLRLLKHLLRKKTVALGKA